MTSWLARVALVMAIALCGSSVAAWALAGSQAISRCCCPDVSSCKCSGDDPQPSTQLKRCGNAADITEPIQIVAAQCACPMVTPAGHPARNVSHAPTRPLVDKPAAPPDVPPF